MTQNQALCALVLLYKHVLADELGAGNGDGSRIDFGSRPRYGPSPLRSPRPRGVGCDCRRGRFAPTFGAPRRRRAQVIVAMGAAVLRPAALQSPQPTPDDHRDDPRNGGKPQHSGRNREAYRADGYPRLPLLRVLRP